MTRLSDTQTILLSAAAARADRALLPVPLSIRVKGKALERSLSALLKRGFAEERAACSLETAWRTEADRALGLHATNPGLSAIGIEAPNAGRDDSSATPTGTERPRGKLETVLSAVEAEGGATLDELVAATSWQPHTTRAAITRLRQRGFPIRLEERDGRKAYRRAA